MEKLNDIFSDLICGKHIVKAKKTEIEELCNILDKIKYYKLIEVLKDVIESTKYTKKLRDTIEKLKSGLQIDGIAEDTKCDLIEDAIKEIEDINLEKILDSECDRYNKFTESNPTEHIYYDKTNKIYIYDNNKKISKKNKSELMVKIKKKILEEKEKLFPKIIYQKNIEYKNKKIIIYLVDNIPYFDINHVFNLIDNKSKKDQYKKYTNKIKLYNIRDNDVGGFYIKEFIDKETFFNILLHTNSTFSDKFKKDVSKLLDKLTSDGTIVIKNDTLTISDNIILKKSNNEIIKDEYIYTQTYDNNELINFIKNEINRCKKMNWHKYCKKHILYFFVITIDDPDGKKRILCKIGYSSDLIERFKSLEYEYKCKFYLLGMKTIYREQDEKEFHKHLKIKFPELIVNLKINKHDKDETYIFDRLLYDTFLKYSDKVEFNSEEIKLEKEIDDMMNNYFKNMENQFEIELINKFKNIIKITNEYEKEAYITTNIKYYEYLLVKENNRHIESMKDKEIYLQKLDKEIELKKLEFDIIKFNK
jgi:hypothetical protein